MYPVAPEQLDGNVKKEAKKESKVHRAKVESPEKPLNPLREEPAAVEQIPGQTDIENDFPEFMPEPSGNKEPETAAGKTAIFTLLDEIRTAVTAGCWGTAMVKANNLSSLVSRAAHGGEDEEV